MLLNYPGMHTMLTAKIPINERAENAIEGRLFLNSTDISTTIFDAK